MEGSRNDKEERVCCGRRTKDAVSPNPLWKLSTEAHRAGTGTLRDSDQGSPEKPVWPAAASRR
jgi:hypothetical protein